ncbi:glutathione peroxidase [Desulfopila aestuarii]|uniref:Glutathione peroxidase n=1 Tax=Desulfopila aestuarii DSM 18488 TaxID=1121416 RepID=A0A1M7YJ65_9BACT|nr:glutathione peroxidase [Desulfopila aestuarii]SHO52568.1 glutathione peroxidase [Desulfopila aestuarii DSM 18488]
MTELYRFDVETIDGKHVNLGLYKNKTLLIVNVASKCGFTSQYDGLEELYKKYADRGLVILGFPCNQFGSQEPGSESEILDICRLNYGVTFPLFAKIEVNGDRAHPLFVYLKRTCPGLFGSEKIKWNFTKFLVDPAGKVVKRFAPTTSPAQLEQEILPLLQPKA